MTAAVSGIDDDQLIAELRKKFKKNYVGLSTSKFDERDVNRIGNDDLYALSFVHWRKGNVTEAAEMVARVLEWRCEHGVTDLSVESIGQQYVERGFCYIHGRGVDGTRVFCMIARFQTKEEKDVMRKVFILWLERLQRKEPGKHITFVLDSNKVAMSNVDLGSIKFIIEAFSTFFPDLLERIIILDMPWIMNAIWKVVKQWMSEEQRSRVFFCSKKDLHQFVPVDQRTKDMGGTSDWLYSFPPFPDDLGQNYDFKDDPMNFKMTDKSQISDATTGSPAASPVEVNGDARHSDGRNSVEDEMPDTTESLLSASPTKPKVSSDRSEDGKGMEGDAARLRKVFPAKKNGQTHEERSIDTPRKNRPVSEDMRSYSMKSIVPKLDQEYPSQSLSKEDKEVDITDEIALGNLLFMSPVSDLAFTLQGERYEGRITIRNPSSMTEEADRNIYVAYKVKTTSPERYHVKPSIGVLAPGDSTRIRIHLSTGFESSMPRDRFLLLYKPIPCGEDDGSFSYENVVNFWKKYSEKSSHFEHRVRVKVSEPGGERRRNQSGSNAPSTPVGLSQGEVTSAKELTDSQLVHQLMLLHNKIMRLESDSRWVRRRMRHTMGILFVIIALMLIILYEVAMISYNLSHNSTDTNDHEEL